MSTPHRTPAYPPVSYEPLAARRTRRKRTRFIVTLICAAVVLLAGSIVAAVLMTGDGPAEPSAGSTVSPSPEESEAPADTTSDTPPPGPGDYRIRVADTDLCMSAGPEPGNEERTVVVLAGCAEAAPPVTLEPAASGGHRMLMDFTEEDWTACLSVDAPADEIGYLFAPYDCADATFADFTLVPHPQGGFGVAVNGTDDMCLDALESTPAVGTAMAIMACDADLPGQRFDFTPV
ncbi:hypothetical protein LX16_1386 [Stackebrandtia albiflava]|uniref:Uncharacterized protein n=1 Tax=Stackebrandtia albiflava TaxID=406432 RepID=A0A562VCT9_9ACTN|nr:hypothetical protein [Stackebrandtia albiflava]TWJ15675.1 hypothetical protein LX16_1386 [Stackebrandtia albiflava]